MTPQDAFWHASSNTPIPEESDFSAAAETPTFGALDLCSLCGGRLDAELMRTMLESYGPAFLPASHALCHLQAERGEIPSLRTPH